MRSASSSQQRPAAASQMQRPAAAAPVVTAPAPPPPSPPPVSVPALCLSVFQTHALFDRAHSQQSAAAPTPASAAFGGVQGLFEVLQSLSRDPASGGHLPQLLALMPASPAARDDGRVLLVSEAWSSSLEQCQEQIGSHLPSLRGLSQSLLQAVSSLNSHGVFHKRWSLLHIRFDAHGRPRLVDTFLNNAQARESTDDDDDAVASASAAAAASEADFIHPAFISPEVMLAGPEVMHDANEVGLLLKSDVYQLAVLLLYLLRGSLPLAPPSPSTQLYGDDSEEAVQQRSMEEVWKLHFTPSSSSSSSASAAPSQHHDDEPSTEDEEPEKHPQCQLCCPPPKPAPVAHVSVARTPQKAQHRDDDGSDALLPPARLCVRCWMDLRNLSASFVSPAVNPLSRVSSSLPSASSTFLAAWSGLLDLLRLLLDPNPLTRPSAAEALCHAFFVTATAKWGTNAAAARNVSIAWRQRLEQGELPESLCSPFQVGSASGVGRLNTARMQMNQIALDPAFGVSGFKSVEVVGTHAGSGTDLASSRVCGVCHQPLAPHIHPSSPAACHCLMPYGCADLYAIWKDALASQGTSVQQWLETQSALVSSTAAPPASEESAQASSSDELEPLQGVTRMSVIDALPALILLGPPAVGSSEPSFTALSLAPPALRASQRFFVPLLPMYHMLRRIIVARQQREISQLWAGLDEMDRLAELQRAEAEASSEAANAAPGSSPKPVRLRKVAPPIESLSSNNGLPSHFSTEGFVLDAFQRFVIMSLSALVDMRMAQKLYPATRGDMMRVAQERVSALYDQAQARPAGGEEWNVFLSGVNSVSSPSIFPASSRAWVWPSLLGVSSRATSDFTLSVDGSTILFDAHPEAEQFNKDCERTASLHTNLDGRMAQVRLRRMMHVYLARHAEVTYWQGMHELLGAVVAVFPPDTDSDALAYATFERVVDRPYMRDMFTPLATQALSRKIDAVTRLVSFVDPILSAHLSALGVGLNMVLVAPLFTAWAHNLPLAGGDGLYKLWDVLFAFAAGGDREEEDAEYGDDERERARAEQARRELEAQESELFYLLPVALLVLLRSFILSKPAAPASPFASASASSGNGFNDVLLELTHQLHTIDPSEWMRMLWRCKRDIHPRVLREVVAAITPQETNAIVDDTQSPAITAALPPDFSRATPSRGGPDLLLCPQLPLASLQSLLDHESAAASSSAHGQLTKGGSSSSLTAAAASPAKRTLPSTSPLLVIDLRAEARRSNPTFSTALAVPSGPVAAAVESVIQYVLEWRTQLEQAHVMAVTKAVQAAAQPPPPVAATSFLALIADSPAQSASFASHLISAGIQHVCTVAL